MLIWVELEKKFYNLGARVIKHIKTDLCGLKACLKTKQEKKTNTQKKKKKKHTKKKKKKKKEKRNTFKWKSCSKTAKFCKSHL